MIKATKTHKTVGETTKIGTEVLVEGNVIDILFEFMGILNAMERECPEVLLKALPIHMEKNHDN